jgi:hypothetical protein
LLLAAVLFAGGCSSGVEDLVARPAAEKADDATSNQPPPPPPPKEPGGDQSDAAAHQQPTPVEPPVIPPTATVPEPSKVPPSVPPAARPQAAPTGQPSIRISMAVALPQTLPTGTAMSFSVEYEFIRGGPNPSATYFWVIEPGKGQAARFQVRLGNSGALPPAFIPGWRPEHGPFQTHIEDASGTKLSRSTPLR